MRIVFWHNMVSKTISKLSKTLPFLFSLSFATSSSPLATRNPTSGRSSSSAMVSENHVNPLPHKVLVITNIKAHILILLDLNRHNYDTWSEFFSTQCDAYDGLNHIDATYDNPTPKPT